MSNVTDKLIANIKEHFDDSIAVSVAYDEVTMIVDSEKELIDLCGVDYLTFGQVEWETGSATGSGFSRGVAKTDEPSGEQVSSHRYAVVYHLLSLKNNCRLRVKAYLPEDEPVLDSVVDVWASANWFEREAFDLFGIMFRSHPDLRRILTDYGFIGH
jgi:NADH-quinone oxidoreductase subunit C